MSAAGKEPLAPAPAPEGAGFDSLLEDLINDPEEVLRADLTTEQLLELQKRLNPYAGIAGPPRPAGDHKRIVAASYTNLREDYIRRFTMTSMVGFLFQVLEEHEVPASRRCWVPRRAAKKEATPCDAAELAASLEAALAIARQAEAEGKEAVSLKAQAAIADLEGKPKSEVEAMEAAAAGAEARAAGLVYAAAHAAHRVGSDAGTRLHATAMAGKAHREVRELIERYPLPSPPGQLEMPKDVAREIVGGFLRDWFEFDPSVHVRAGHDAAGLAAATVKARYGSAEVPVDAADPGHLTLAALVGGAPKPVDSEVIANLEELTRTPRHRAAALLLLREPKFADAALFAMQAPEEYLQWLGPLEAASEARGAADHRPPQDTFHRWNYYTEVNYEELRTVTEALYPERSDLDWAIALWNYFEGTAKEVDEAFDKHCQKYQDETPSAIKALEFGAWSLLADFKENRANVRFYNKHTEVLKRILDRHAEDKKLGADLMRQRVRASKAKNIAEAGPDAPGLNRYRRQAGDLGSKGAERVITPAEMKRLERAKGDLKAAKELEVLEQKEETVKRLTELGETRALTVEEARELEAARAEADRAREMLSVPDDAIQVDVFTADPRAGTFAKTHFYTKAEAPIHLGPGQGAASGERPAQAGPSQAQGQADS